MVTKLRSVAQREVQRTLLYSGALLDCHIRWSVASLVGVCVELWLCQNAVYLSLYFDPLYPCQYQLVDPKWTVLTPELHVLHHLSLKGDSLQDE